MCAHWKKNFPSRYLQTSDPDDGPIETLIVGIGAENICIGTDAELKLVAKLRDAKSVVLNQTKCNALEGLAGSPDTETWVGTRIRLCKGTTTYKGKRVPCIVVEPPTPAAEAVGF
jgi:hypothetical protein